MWTRKGPGASRNRLLPADTRVAIYIFSCSLWESWQGSTITHHRYCSALIMRCPLVFQPSQTQTLNILFMFLILYFYFQFLALCRDRVQRHRLTGGQTRLRRKPCLLWHAPPRHKVGKKQLIILAVILQPSCPYPVAVHGTGLFACGRGLTSRLPLPSWACLL